MRIRGHGLAATTAGSSATTAASKGGASVDCAAFATAWRKLYSDFVKGALHVADFKNEVAAVRSSVPPELKDDFETATGACVAYWQAFSSGKDMTSAGKQVHAPTVTAAEQNINDFASTHCQGN